MKVEQIAELCHEANKTYCHLNGDDSQKSWLEAEQWQRDSAITGVRFSLAHPEATPELQHESWLRDKQRDGWVRGDVKDAALKEHPCMVDFKDLPVEQQMKDHLFRGIVHSFKSVICK